MHKVNSFHLGPHGMFDSRGGCEWGRLRVVEAQLCNYYSADLYECPGGFTHASSFLSFFFWENVLDAILVSPGWMEKNIDSLCVGTVEENGGIFFRENLNNRLDGPA